MVEESKLTLVVRDNSTKDIFWFFVAVKAEFLDEKEEITSWWFNFQVESQSEGCEGRVFRWEREVYFLVIQFPSGILIFKLTLIWKAVKAESCQTVKAESWDEKEKFSYDS